jgi:hypothetical protein
MLNALILNAHLASVDDSGSLEGVIVCLLVVALVTAAVYFVAGHLLRQSWAATAAAVIFVVGALLCLL